MIGMRHNLSDLLKRRHSSYADTKMVTGVIAAYKANGVPIHEPKHVVNAFLHSLTSGNSGEALCVSSGKVIKIENKMDNWKSQWLGEELYDELQAGQQVLDAERILNAS